MALRALLATPVGVHAVEALMFLEDGHERLQYNSRRLSAGKECTNTCMAIVDPRGPLCYPYTDPTVGERHGAPTAHTGNLTGKT